MCRNIKKRIQEVFRLTFQKILIHHATLMRLTFPSVFIFESFYTHFLSSYPIVFISYSILSISLP